MLALPSRSSKPSLAGLADAWHRSTHALLIVDALRSKPCQSSRTISELLLSHLCICIVAPTKNIS